MSLFLTCQVSQGIRNSISRNVKLKKSQLSSSFRRITQESFNGHKFVPFLDIIESRRDQARRSILVQVQSSQSYKELHSYCTSLGNVKEMQHYVVGVEHMNFIIVEFASESDVENVLKESSHVQDCQAVPIHSQFLWFRASNRKLPKLKQSKNAVLNVDNGTNILTDSEVRDFLRKAPTLSDQMEILYEKTKLNDIGTRLRYLTARQIENAVKGMFPTASALPFGSSVNGFGKMGCDLDLVLRLSNQNIREDARLVFHCKAHAGSERSTSQRNMEVMGDLIQLFLPGCAQVRRILQAKVPIIKYYQQLTDVECDLSMLNVSGVHMSDYLYMMGCIDQRIRPLVFTVRKWAHEVGLTNASPGRWITNFSLTLMVLGFLQQPIHSPPILPSLNALVKLAGKEDAFVTEDGINCTFLRDITKLGLPAAPSSNAESLEGLLKEFFAYYSQFDFERRAICLNEAVSLAKPEHCPLYIVNPLERGLNVSKNVSIEELDRFKVEARNAAWLLESQEHKVNQWGLLSLFENKRRQTAPINFQFATKQGRLMNVSALFTEELEGQEIVYKSESVKKQVENIKNNTKNKLKEIHKLNR